MWRLGHVGALGHRLEKDDLMGLQQGVVASTHVFGAGNINCIPGGGGEVHLLET